MCQTWSNCGPTRRGQARRSHAPHRLCDFDRYGRPTPEVLALPSLLCRCTDRFDHRLSRRRSRAKLALPEPTAKELRLDIEGASRDSWTGTCFTLTTLSKVPSHLVAKESLCPRSTRISPVASIPIGVRRTISGVGHDLISYDNPLLKTPLAHEHVKPRLLGHWGTTPGLNFIYAHLNRLIKKYELDILYVTGPGHGGPGIVANAYLEGTYSEESIPTSRLNEAGMKRLFKQFSVPRRHSQPCGAGDAGVDSRGR